MIWIIGLFISDRYQGEVTGAVTEGQLYIRQQKAAKKNKSLAFPNP
jgi:hypothetical protein